MSASSPSLPPPLGAYRAYLARSPDAARRGLFTVPLGRGHRALDALFGLGAEMKRHVAAGTIPVLLTRVSVGLNERALTALERISARASVRGGPNLELDGECAVLRAERARREGRQQHADVRSALRASVQKQHEALRAPSVGRDFDAALWRAEADATDAVIDALLGERAAHYGLQREGYLSALAERIAHAAGAVIVRCADVPPYDDVLDGETLAAHPARTAFIAAADAMVADLDVVLDAVADGRAPPSRVVQLAGTSVPTNRLTDIMQLHAQRSGDGAQRWAPLANAAAEVLGSRARAKRVLGVARGVRQKAQTRLLRRAPFKAPIKPTARLLNDERYPPQGARVIARAAQSMGATCTALDDQALRDLCARVHHADVAAPPPVATAALAPPRYDDLGALLNDAVRRYGDRPALSIFAGEVRHDVTYTDLLARARAVATRLVDTGAEPGARVVLSAQNHPDWVVCFFGIVLARCVAVPLDPGLAPAQVRTVLQKAQPVGAILDRERRDAWRDVVGEPCWDVHLMATAGSDALDASFNTAMDAKRGRAAPTDVASILFTSGTTGEPKGVMLTHENFTALVASLTSLFDMSDGDRALSVLPLHHTLEFSCGLLMPLVAGAQVFYLDALNGDRLAYVLKQGRITGMIGVPALWQLLERKIVGDVERGSDAQRFAFDVLRRVNDALGARFGVDLGPVLFRQVHQALGGHLRVLVSGGAALPAPTHALFRSLGMHLSEGYGLTESAPVLTLAQAGPGEAGAHVGRAIPGVQVEIRDPNAQGAGEVWARGPNVMAGYFENPDATAHALVDGWLRTGDVGRIDDEGALVLVGREKDVVVTASGENIYLDDAEALLTPFPGAEEFCLVGVPEAAGGERLALCVFPGEGNSLTDADVKRHCSALPAYARPQHTVIVGAPLPKTATRKVKRKDTVPLVERHLARAQAERSSAIESGGAPLVDARLLSAVALVAGVDVATLTPLTGLHTDLGFDSLMWVELQSALLPLSGAVDAEALFLCETILDVQRLDPSAQAPTEAKNDEAQGLRLPRILVNSGRRLLTAGQRDLYRSLFESEVTGRAHIPHNENVIVVANHQSHLDTGLVKFALGRFGHNLRPLAAQDYFFEGNRFKVAFFENFTNLVALDRKSGSGGAYDVAADLLTQGHSILIYPEGTRRADGTLGDFKPLVGRLSMATGRSVLPLYLGGTYDVLPRGAALPRGRQLVARIGIPLRAEALRAATAHLAPVEQTRAATATIRDAVIALRDGAPFRAPSPPPRAVAARL